MNVIRAFHQSKFGKGIMDPGCWDLETWILDPEITGERTHGQAGKQVSQHPASRIENPAYST